MQIDHIVTAGFLVRTIDILRNELIDGPSLLQSGQLVVGDVWFGLGKTLPPQHAARPIASTDESAADELGEASRFAVFPAAVWAAVIGYTRRSAAAYAR